MKIIKTFNNQYIAVDPQPCEPGYVWGKRWNKQIGAWSNQCMLWPDGVPVHERDLPIIKPLELE